MYNNSYPTPREGRINLNNGRRLANGFKYERKPGKWDYVKYNHSYAFCNITGVPTCRIPPDDGEGRLHINSRFPRDGTHARGPRSARGPHDGPHGHYNRNGHRGRRGAAERRQLRSRTGGYPRQGRGVIYLGKYYREGYYPRAPFYDRGGGPGLPRHRPFGKTNMMWKPNPEV